MRMIGRDRLAVLQAPKKVTSPRPPIATSSRLDRQCTAATIDQFSEPTSSSWTICMSRVSRRTTVLFFSGYRKQGESRRKGAGGKIRDAKFLDLILADVLLEFRRLEYESVNVLIVSNRNEPSRMPAAVSIARFGRWRTSFPYRSNSRASPYWPTTKTLSPVEVTAIAFTCPPIWAISRTFARELRGSVSQILPCSPPTR